VTAVLVTGGAGYIGSHTCVELLEAGYQVDVVDNLINSSAVAVERVRELTSRDVRLHRIDLRHAADITELVASTRFEAIIHFAGLKAVGESVRQPLRYYDNNLVGTLNLLRAARAQGVRQVVFSSSATVYGDPEWIPLTEDHPRRPTNPYGRTKMMIEDFLSDLAGSEDGWRIISLRYFNPVGAHPSGRIGEDPEGIPNNLMPYVGQVAAGRLEFLPIFGGDYPTPDGTGVRDYVHVVDLAAGHVAALRALPSVDGHTTVNLGTGRGYSVLELVAAMSAQVGRDLPYRMAERRAGDVARMWADPSRAESLLGWKAGRDLEEMCRDQWNWVRQNPTGYH
jgi:UDP-glucose 4-epimerase